MDKPVNFKGFSNLYDSSALKDNWGWFLVLGLVFIALGILSIIASTFVTLISVIFLGSLLTIGGILQTGYAFWLRKWSVFFTSLLAGIVYIIAGVFLLMHPLAGAISLTLFLAIFYIIGGIFRIASSVYLRFDQWQWACFSGFIKFLLGVLILQQWPSSGLWIIGLFIGIDFLFFGWFWVIMSLESKKL